MSRPSLQDIASMPYPASRDAMRKYYNPDWGKPIPDGSTLQVFKIKIEYTYQCEDSGIATVEAFTEEEAIDAAFDEVTKGLSWDQEPELQNHTILSVSEGGVA